MTLVSLPSPIFYPGIIGALAGNPSISTLATVSSAGQYASYIFAAKESMTISHVGFRAGTATGSPTIEVRIETVDATGLPSGTLWATNTNGTTGTITSNSDVLQALTASASITKGQVFCVMIKWASGTSQVIQQLGSITSPSVNSLPYAVLNTGTPTKSSPTSMALIALGSSSTVFYQVPGTFPISAVAGGGFNNTNSAKRGLRFVPPMNCRAIGIRFWVSNTAGDYNAVLFDDAGNELSGSSTAYDGDQNSGSVAGMTNAYFDNAVTLTAGTAYRAAIEPTSATNTQMSLFTLPSSNYFTATPAGSNAVYASFATATWTDSTTQLPFLDVIIDQVDNGSGSGGGAGAFFGA